MKAKHLCLPAPKLGGLSQNLTMYFIEWVTAESFTDTLAFIKALPSLIHTNFYAVSKSLISFWPLWVRNPESLPTKFVNCVVLCIVFVLMCTVLLPPGVNTIAVNKYIKYQILPGNSIVRILICPSKINTHSSESITISVSRRWDINSRGSAHVIY